MSLTKTKYHKYLTAYKNKEYPSSPATESEYVNWWEDALRKDLLESVEDGGFQMHFHPFQKDGPLLVLDKKGNLPEKYSKKFEAYPLYGVDLGLDVVVECSADGVGGQVYSVRITKHDRPIQNYEFQTEQSTT